MSDDWPYGYPRLLPPIRTKKDEGPAPGPKYSPGRRGQAERWLDDYDGSSQVVLSVRSDWLLNGKLTAEQIEVVLDVRDRQANA